ncbi:MAG TPA: UbiA family prenyltransferase, partial [Verrucomicrobiae bacterium]|nr:UbiA family prenyltransferase [Verrucomicrobiae bacterium]
MIRGLFQLLRVHHWTKNAFCLAGLFFSGRFTHLWSVGQAVLVFFAFSFASSAVYVLNDLVDIERDTQHPKKRNRPLPRG